MQLTNIFSDASQKLQLGSEHLHCAPVESTNAISSHIVVEQQERLSEVLTKSSLIEQLGLPPEDKNRIPRTEESEPTENMSKNSSLKQFETMPTNIENVYSTEQLEPTENVAKNSNRRQLETTPTNIQSNSSQLDHRAKKTSKLLKNKYMLRSSVGTDVGPKLHEKPKAPQPSSNLSNVSNGGEKRKNKKKKQLKNLIPDEYSEIRRHLRYFLHRIKYEQNLIDAYSSEGWKGLSLEKLKPEKELQRATSEILRRKVKIRDLFQRLDALCADGRLPISSFDSEGEISCEDIFCAKCGSKNVSADNDIILCDACDRGFHQYCLVPPMLKEDIPPGDEDWLCSGCDCKVDCIDLLNDAQGTNLLITDSWEKVFPEASAQNQDHNCEPSDEDSQDDDYNPDNADIADKSSSDESECTSKSGDSAAPPNNELHSGLHSEDSEDDDYDPDVLDLDEKVKEGSSSSDFTSDSEDFDTTMGDQKSSGEDDGKSFRGSHRRKSERRRNQYLNHENVSISETDPLQDDVIPVRGKRHVERLDYKKLHDETYGDLPTDSSDEEIWSDTVTPRKRNNVNRKVKDSGDIPKKSASQKQNVEGSIDLGSPHSGSNDRIASTSANRRLGEAKTQMLYKSFKENQYPDRAMKERLAAELELTVKQVNKWFGNARWSFRHASCTVPCSTACTARYSSRKATTLIQTNNKPFEPVPQTINRDSSSTEANAGGDGTVPECSSGPTRDTTETEESSTPKSRTPISRKRKGKLDQLASDLASSTEEKLNPPADLPKASEEQSGVRVQTRRRKSVV